MNHNTYIGTLKALGEAIKGTMWDGHVYMVGGCVRDELMHQELHDIDLCVDMPNGGIRFVRWLEKHRKLIRGRRPQFFVHFGTAKMRLRLYPKEEIDVVQTRKDRYEYEEHPKPEENFGTILEDAIRRDLTINSLYVNVSTGELQDPTGMGMEDLKNHVIRTPNNPDVTFRDNAMHILRTVRFAVKYGWDIPEDLLESMRRNVDILEEITPKRTVKELTALLSLAEKARGLRLLEEVGAMKYILPYIKKVDQPETVIRQATPDDAAELVKIYAPYVQNTAVSFEYEVPAVEEFRSRIVSTLENYPYLVAEEEGIIVGYAYAGRFQKRAAYSHCAEVSIYIQKDECRHGVGRRLYEQLETLLKSQGITNLYACIAWTERKNRYLGNQSQEFHSHMGYRKCAHFHKCGYKFSQWYDMIWMEKMIGEHK